MRSAAELIDLLAREPRRFDFFRAVDLVERLLEGSVPVGQAGPAEGESIRFEHDPSLIFHASDVLAIEPRDLAAGRRQTIIRTGFLGLTGVVSPLPMVMTEEVLAADASDQPAVRAFYDVIHHRVISLFYRAWRKYRFDATYDDEGRDPFTRRALALVGVDIAGALPERGVPPALLLALAPIVTQRNRSRQALVVALRRALPGVHVHVEPFVLRRSVLDAEQRVTLGVRNCVLGHDMAIGRSVADRTTRFRASISGLDATLLADLSPGGARYALLCAIIAQFSGCTLQAEVELEVGAEHVPRFRLGAPSGARLGESTRLGSRAERPVRCRFIAGAPDARPVFVQGEEGGEPAATP
jgi:type VI secretion system protein ImpH